MTRDLRDLQDLVRPLYKARVLVLVILDDICRVVRLEAGWLERRLEG